VTPGDVALAVLTAVLVYVVIYVVAILPGLRLGFALFGRTQLSESDYLIHDRHPGEIAIDAVIRTVGDGAGLPVIDLQPPFTVATTGRITVS